MLQTRFENEQFNSLPFVFTNNRLRNDYITTDRPDSAQLVDLHIYIIPKFIWKNIQHLAQNEAMDDAISAGFVRVSPDMKLRNLRQSIERLCGKENYFPREFIFLRSVGRCLTRVKQTQEYELKVKNYRPPQTSASEIYLLEGRHEDYGNTPSVSPALSSASYLFGNRRRHRFNLDDDTQELPRLTHKYHLKPLRVEKNGLPVFNTNHVTYRRPLSGRKSWSRFTQVGSDPDDSSPNTSVVTSITSRELVKLKEEQERLRRRQAELERMRRAAEEKKLNSERGENERQRRQQEKEELEREENERQRRQQEEEELEREEKERQRLQQEKQRDEAERRRQVKDEAERRRLERLEAAATKIQATFRGFRDRQAFRERQNNFMKNASRKSSTKSHTTLKNERKIDMNDDDEFSDGNRIISRTSIGSTSDLDSDSSRPETRTIKKENRESIHSNSSSLSLSMKTERIIRSSLHSKLEDLSLKDNEDIRAATVTKTRHLDREISRSTPDINDDDAYELKRREDDVKQREADAKRRRQAEEEQRQREYAKIQKCEDVGVLRARLQELRTERAGLEKIRDEVIKQLRQMHQRITLRRRDARDMWKKKYFQEKKKTPAMEDRSTQLRTDLDLIHSKIVQTIDNGSKHSAEAGRLKEAEVGSLILRITRLQYETQDSQHQLDQAKLRLTTDIKLRNQADNECRSLKHELSQAKMNLNHIKNRRV